MSEDSLSTDACQWCNSPLMPSETNCSKCGTLVGLSASDDAGTREISSPILDKFWNIVAAVFVVIGLLIWLFLGPGLLIFGIVNYVQGTTGIENMKGNNPGFGLQVVGGVIMGIVGIVITLSGILTWRGTRRSNL